MEKAFPSNRQLKKLWELWTLIRWVSYKKQDLLPQYKDWCISLLRANNIQETLDLSDLQYLPTWYIKEEQVLEENDVLFCMSSGSSHLVGKNIKLPHLDNFSFGAFCSIFRLNNEGLIDSDYLSHYLHSRFYSDYITNIARGAGINNLRNSDLESLQIPLPPLEEQKKIVAYLDEINATITKLKSDYQAQLTALDEMRNSSLDLAFWGSREREREREHTT